MLRQKRAPKKWLQVRVKTAATLSEKPQVSVMEDELLGKQASGSKLLETVWQRFVVIQLASDSVDYSTRLKHGSS